MSTPHHRLHAKVGTLRQLEILLALRDNGSVNAAAKALFLSQPSVSIQLKKLADAIGSPLYEVKAKQLQFTDAGLELINTAEEVLDSFSRLEMKLSDIHELKSGTLRLAVVTTSKYFIPHLLGPFCETYPGIDVQMKIGNRQQIIDRLHQGTDDLYVFSHPPKDIDAERITLLDNPLVAIAAEDHPLAGKKRLPLNTISKEPFLIREPGSGTRFAIERFLQERALELNIKMTIESNEAIKHAVMSRLGVSIVSAHTLAYGGMNGLSRLDIEELPIKSRWHFLWNSRRRLSIIASAFLDHVQSNGLTELHTQLAKEGLRD